MATCLRKVYGEMESVLAVAARAGGHWGIHPQMPPTVEESDGTGSGGTYYHDQPECGAAGRAVPNDQPGSGISGGRK